MNQSEVVLHSNDVRHRNNAGKGENSDYQHVLLSLQCFQKTTFSGSLKVGIVWQRVNAVFNNISVILRPSVHLSMLSRCSFTQYSAQYSFKSHWLISLTTTVKTMDSGERNESCRNDSSVLGKNTGRAEDRTSDLLFSSPVRYRLSMEHSCIGDNQTLDEGTKTVFQQFMGRPIFFLQF